MGGKGSGHLPEDLTTQKFGRLTPLRIIGHKPIIWECLCDCGTIIPVCRGNLSSGNTSSCGCLQKIRVSESVRHRPYEALFYAFLRKSQRKKPSLKRKIDLSYEEFVEFTGEKECHYCGAPISWAKFNPHKNGTAYNLDRKNNAIGYTKENCVVCCFRCNRGKSDLFTYEEWVEIGRCIRAFNLKTVALGV